MGFTKYKDGKTMNNEELYNMAIKLNLVGEGIKYDRDLEPFDSWEESKIRFDGKRLMKTYVGDYCVSTVWLGINHNFKADEPIVFETMIFNTNTSSYYELYTDKYLERYKSEEEAGRGHLRIVDNIRAGWIPELGENNE